jgi:glycosyltransferase involved in cell wall biosynthesis
MHIAVCGPVSLDLLADLLDDKTGMPRGYVCPLIAFIVRAYIARGHFVTVITSTGDVAHVTRWHGKSCNIIATPRRLKAASLVGDLFRTEVRLMRDELIAAKPDVAHAQWCYEFADAALGSGIVTLVTAHDSPWRIAYLLKHPYRWIRAFYAQFWILPRIKYLSTVSPYMIRALRSWNGYWKPITLVPNGIGRQRMNPKPILKDGKLVSPRILTVSEWGDHKNIKITLDAFGIIQLKLPNAQLTLVGSGLGPEGPAQAYCRSHNIPIHNILFCGYQTQEHVIEMLRKDADIFVITTLEESFCMTLLEAMAQGVPCIGGYVSGAVPWLLDEGRSGLLVNVKSASAVADAVARMCDDSVLRKATARNGYCRVKEQFLIEHVAGKYLNVLERIRLNSKNM